MLEARDYLITVVELPAFSRTAGGLLSPEEIDGLILFLAHHPDDGVIIPETGGLRKVRWGARNKGKRGGSRVIYYFRDLNMPLYLLTLYSKGERIDLSKADKLRMRKVVEQIVDAQWAHQVAPRVLRMMKPSA